MTHQSNNGKTALDFAVESNNDTAISELLKFAYFNKLQPVDIMSPASSEKTIRWSQERKFDDLTDYLQIAAQQLKEKQPEGTQLTTQTTIPFTLWGYRIFKSPTKSEPANDDLINESKHNIQ